MKAQQQVAWLLALVTLRGMAADDGDTGYEIPPDEPPAASLPAEQVSGADFKIEDPVRSDGLMRHYVVDSRYGRFEAYGREALAERLREVAALRQIARTTDVEVVARAVGRQVSSSARSVVTIATHPINTVVGIPTGIAHLFTGYVAQGQEISAQLKALPARATSVTAPGSAGTRGAVAAGQALRDLTVRNIDRYWGVSAAERRWSERLQVDPYAKNPVLRKAIRHLAHVDATAGLGLKFVSLPTLPIPYAAEMARALEAIYHEDPAVLRARRRDTLLAFGLSRAEIEQFDHSATLSPTRQRVLEEVAGRLDGVDGRAELFRQAMSLNTDEEVQVYLESVRLLADVHARQPLARILAGPLLPTAQRADGRKLVFGAFESVYWTEAVAADERALHQALPPESEGVELWLSGGISTRARAELAARGWLIREAGAPDVPSR